MRLKGEIKFLYIKKGKLNVDTVTKHTMLYLLTLT